MTKSSVKKYLRLVFWWIFSTLLLTKSILPPADTVEQIRSFTRYTEFDYISWTIDAVFDKICQTAVDIPRFLSGEEQLELVRSSLSLTEQIRTTEAVIETIYADPNIDNPDIAASEAKSTLQQLKTIEKYLEPLSETILQQQASRVLQDLSLAYGGQPIPPLLYRITPLPYALIVSPRDVIRQDADISLLPDMSLENRIRLEQEVEENLDVSALVVPVGGVGVYPTMVLSTANLPSLTDIITHEWTHNYLTLRPLGINYFTSNALRTMNETTANISGKEIGQTILSYYYPEYLPQITQTLPDSSEQSSSEETIEPPAFNFQKEMHETRVNVDRMLSEGKIEEAETYMEERRQFLWENGYQIRRLNQAYFAFYGAYADSPVGAAGEDPVGAAVSPSAGKKRLPLLNS